MSEMVMVVENKDQEQVNKYKQVSDTFMIQYLHNSLSHKCDDLVKFQKRILEQLDLIIQRLAQK